MKTINNIDTEQPLNEWLYEKKDDKTIMIKTRQGDYTTLSGYKIELNENLKDKECEETDVMEILDISNLSEIKLLWERGKMLSEEKFMEEYHKVFDNKVNWNNLIEEKYSIVYNFHYGYICYYSVIQGIHPNIRYSNNKGATIDFINQYEPEIREYLFNQRRLNNEK